MKVLVPQKYSRRAFVRATGLGLGLLPLLETDRAEAAEGSAKRVALIAWPNGVRSGDWWPDATKGSIDYSEAKGHGVTETAFSFNGLKMIEPLEVHRGDMILFHGVRLATSVSGGHESQPHMFTVGGGQTLDQHLAEKQTTPFKSVNLGVQKRDNRGHIYRKGQNVTLEQDPYKTFETLFAGRAIDPAIFERQRAARRSILDYVGKQLGGFAKILGTADRARVDFHLNSIREIEKRLTVPAGGAGMAGAPPSLPANKFDVKNVSNFHLAARAQLDLIALAFASDSTRVATLLLSDGDGSNLATPWLGPEFALDTGERYLGIQNSHHTASHRESEKHAQMQRWFCTELAAFIQKLKDTPDPAGGRLFDSSVVLVMNNMNTGGGHGTNNLPIFLAGSGGGYFRTGRYIKAGGANQNGILAAIASAMGNPVSGLAEMTRLKA